MTKQIGYWYSISEPQYPKPIENSATDEEVQVMLKNLEDFKKKAKTVAYRGISLCRICGKWNGNEEYEYGIFVIPAGLENYIRDHKVKVKDLIY